MCPVAARAMAAVAAPRLTLGDVVRAHGDTYGRTHGLASIQRRALRAIAACRTALLGGRRERCDQCGATRLTYNSCRNRHCATCQGRASAQWVEARRAAADTLLTFGRDPRHLGGTIGVTAILHTWSQTLTQHLHVHCLVTGGALSRDRTRWIRGRAAFLFPVKALSIVFRAKYLAGLQHAFDERALTFAGGTTPLADARQFAALVGQLRATPWVVYAKRPFAGPEQVLQYLGRYTHRIAISNARLLSLTDGIVRFHWKDYTDHGRTKIMALQVEVFLRRFLVHVLPRGFVRIRHFGLLANRQRGALIAGARHLLHAPTPTAPADGPATTAAPTRCPVCHQGHWQVEILSPRPRQPASIAFDTS